MELVPQHFHAETGTCCLECLPLFSLSSSYGCSALWGAVCTCVNRLIIVSQVCFLLGMPFSVVLWQSVQRFAVVDLSNFYFDVSKDRLYVG